MRRRSMSREEALYSVIELVQEMRELQKVYFKKRDQQTLVLAKAAERRVDDALKHLDELYLD
jgi:hypothetical protein